MGLNIEVESVGMSDITITITVSDSIFHNNQALIGANMKVSVYDIRNMYTSPF